MTTSASPVKGESLHRHHIIPRHAGGDDSPENLVYLTVEDHAIAHRVLWKLHGRIQDRLAWEGLSGHNTDKEYMRIELSKEFLRKHNPMKDPKHKSRQSNMMKGNVFGNVPYEILYNDGTSVVYESGKQAAKETGIPYSTIVQYRISGKSSRKHNIRRVIQHVSN